jgi:leader peptidase (prepilin peptidase)/N-methyltransferase
MIFSYNFFIFASIIVFIFGLIVGSFLNVLIFRLPNNISILYPPSSCPYCKFRLKFYDNIPLLSYIVLRGKCRHCGNKISFIYPLIELLTAFIFYILFVKVFYRTFFYYNINVYNINFFTAYLWHNLYLFISYIIFASILIPAAFIDLFHKIIPDSLNFTLILSGFILNIFLLKNSFLFPLLGFIAGGAFFYIIAISYSAIRKQEGLGGGDIKLIAGIGSFIGIKGVFFVIFTGSVFALIGFLIIAMVYSSLRLLIVNRRVSFRQKTTVPLAGSTSQHHQHPAFNDKLDINLSSNEQLNNTKISFGPFLSLAAIFYLFYGKFIVNLYLSFIKK